LSVVVSKHDRKKFRADCLNAYPNSCQRQGDGDKQPPYFNQIWKSGTWLDELSKQDKSVGNYTFVQISDKIFFSCGPNTVICSIN